MGLGSVSITAIAGKNAPVIAPIVAGALAVNSDTLVTVGAGVLGLFFGAMWRTGSFISEGKTWPEIRSDWFISITIGGANAVLTLALVEWLSFGLMFTMAMGVVIGATGLRALPELRAALMEAAKRRLLSDGVAMIQPKDSDINAKVKRLRDPVNPTEGDGPQ